MGRIVVGVDGSDASLDALRWALHEARLRSAQVVAAYVWLFPSLGLRSDGTPPPGYEELRQSARELLDEAADAVAADAEGVAVERVIVEGAPPEELAALADGAEMLVLGSRGLGGFTGLLLGSVSQQCAHHARCPVVIVRHGATGEDSTQPSGSGR